MLPNPIKINVGSKNLQIALKDVTILVGSNESGKSLTLDKLHTYFCVHHSDYISLKFDMGSNYSELNVANLIQNYKIINGHKITSTFKRALAKFNLVDHFNFMLNCNELELLEYNLDSVSRGVRKLICLFTYLEVHITRNGKKSIVLIDEPETSLHVKYQRILIESLTDIYPDCIFILATHAPGIVSNGYKDCLFKMEYILTDNN